MRTHSDRYRALVVGVCAWALMALTSVLHAATDGVVTLAPASVTASGIVTMPLTATQQTAQVQATASVLDPQPLLALAAQLQATHARAAAAVTAAHAATAEAKRAQALYRQGENASLREVQAAAAAAAMAQAQRIAASADDAAARSSARAQWGNTLAALATSGPQALHAFADGNTALLAVVLPIDSTDPATATIQLPVPRGGTVSAHLIGSSPRVDAVVQGPTFFYQADDSGLRVGQRLTASVPLGTSTRSGVSVPAVAVLWYAGQPWAYVATSAGHYQRRPLTLDARSATGWFQASGFRAGERVVVRGGELLLSQELQPPPGAKPAGGDDDDG